MARPFLLAALLVGATAFVPASAACPGGECGGCDAKGNLALGVITLGSGRADDPLPTFYVDDRNYLFGNGIWIYQESNGQDGLQRGGSSPWVPSDGEICTDDSDHGPDTLWL